MNGRMHWPALVWLLLKHEQTYRAKGLPSCFTMLKCDARNLNVPASCLPVYSWSKAPLNLQKTQQMQRGANSLKKVVSSQNSHYFSLEKTPEWFADQIWYVYHLDLLCKRNQWIHFAPDDGGIELQFFWHALRAPPPPDCGALYARVLNYARPQLLKQLEL